MLCASIKQPPDDEWYPTREYPALSWKASSAAELPAQIAASTASRCAAQASAASLALDSRADTSWASKAACTTVTLFGTEYVTSMKATGDRAARWAPAGPTSESAVAFLVSHGARPPGRQRRCRGNWQTSAAVARAGSPH